MCDKGLFLESKDTREAALPDNKVTTEDTKDASAEAQLLRQSTRTKRKPLRDILSAPLGQTLYDTLKKAILERTAISERRRLQMLLPPTELGDRRPSQLLRQMQALLGVRASSFDDALLKNLYEIAPSQLPVPNTSSESRTSTTLAATLSSSRSPTPSTSSSSQDDITDLRADIQRLTDIVASNLTTTADDASAVFGET
ncbi:hypothetical protein HPB52_008449 [Rhipicephalus sanguineus]|uniref:Uncharacterized protein n=1 Tax=Rhipicephalus sanguineus TaxID=34632 RepID=A0A9D4PCJ2_RHISA|nr:hypothetical protein HPB52_008449 [Rhipicephalus sanguineus]